MDTIFRVSCNWKNTWEHLKCRLQLGSLLITSLGLVSFKRPVGCSAGFWRIPKRCQEFLRIFAGHVQTPMQLAGAPRCQLIPSHLTLGWILPWFHMDSFKFVLGDCPWISTILNGFLTGWGGRVANLCGFFRVVPIIICQDSFWDTCLAVCSVLYVFVGDKMQTQWRWWQWRLPFLQGNRKSCSGRPINRGITDFFVVAGGRRRRRRLAE